MNATNPETVKFSLKKLDEALAELVDAQDEEMQSDPRTGDHPFAWGHHIFNAEVRDDDERAEVAVAVVVSCIADGYNYEYSWLRFLKESGDLLSIETAWPPDTGIHMKHNFLDLEERDSCCVLDFVSRMTEIIKERTAAQTWMRNRDCYSAEDVGRTTREEIFGYLDI